MRTYALFFLMIASAHAHDLGTYGATFEVSEESLLDVISRRLSQAKESGKLDVLQKEFVERVKKGIQEPSAVNLPKCVFPRIFLFDPSLTLEEDIKDHEGNLIAAKGTKVNPLETLSWGAPMLFIDGKDDAQVMWACAQAQQHPSIKIILTRGRPIQMEEEKGFPIYFDQGGVLTTKFGIRSVPARVSQKGSFLKIEEIVLTTTGGKTSGIKN